MGAHSPGTLRDSCKGALEIEHLSLYGGSVRGPWRGGAPLLGALKVTKGSSGDGHPSLWMLRWATWSGLFYRGL